MRALISGQVTFPQAGPRRSSSLATSIGVLQRPVLNSEDERPRVSMDRSILATRSSRSCASSNARFVSPQVAELLSTADGERLLTGHRAYISVFFCDLRGFTSFVETAAPEELIELLGEYHAVVGELVATYEGTLEHFAGDGVMVFFNDPAPVDQHELRAITMARAARALRGARHPVAEARLPPRLGNRDRCRIRDARPDRIRRPLRLWRARTRHQPRISAQLKGRRRPDPDQPTRLRCGRRKNRCRARR